MTHGNYLQATRHPWACLLFLLPLLAAYEGGVLWLNAAHPEAVRNGADAWLRQSLGHVGLPQTFWAPLLVVGLLGVWSTFRQDDSPEDLFGVCCGMAVESVAAALGLWVISRSLGPILDELGIALALAKPLIDTSAGMARGGDAALSQIVTYVGAGIYEELLFRFLLYSGLYGMFRLTELPSPLAVVLAGTVSATLFSAAHHLGVRGEPFDGYIFLFRALAGFYFALVYQLRGFGIAVGGHAFYDVMVGVAFG